VDSLLCELRDDVDLVVADSLGEERSDGLTVERSAGEGGAVGVAELELEGSKQSVDDGGLDGESHGKNSDHKSQELEKKWSKELSQDDGGEDSDEKREELLQLSSNIQTSILLSGSIVRIVVGLIRILRHSIAGAPGRCPVPRAGCSVTRLCSSIRKHTPGEKCQKQRSSCEGHLFNCDYFVGE